MVTGKQDGSLEPKVFLNFIHKSSVESWSLALSESGVKFYEEW